MVGGSDREPPLELPSTPPKLIGGSLGALEGRHLALSSPWMLGSDGEDTEAFKLRKTTDGS